ncbi:Vegetative incompatibility protein HET-E-1 [Madurella mycetomatis]|uniref:Vegetative incompatibility protein HET-E-1 n=1 Tax=Madurella mycetomatis TaxID=100816 RepID=A0A175WDL7_9PEZI|nr:Vegetative incompatibility protein HET-E-1 [Madurella mycetomatis]
MRLLNVQTLRLEDKGEGATYAILSHRWEDEEILFEDVSVRDGIYEEAKHKLGYIKLEGACSQAQRDGFEYLWCDTCCIDKSSSAELSEAINSMYRYYQQAAICYAYLAGLPEDTDAQTDVEFANHEWFTRGWTLQELIAPKEVLFFTERRRIGGPELPKKSSRTGDWTLLGRKSDLCTRLSSITGIDTNVLRGSQEIRSISIAKRMSWAAKRVTTRIEDCAYCLLGLFGINMPMLYGENEKAFIRLQEEIMKDSSDESLFAWRDENANTDALTGLLASSPSMFKDSGRFFAYYDWEPRVPYFKTNHGLQITLRLTPVESNDLYVAALNCPRPFETDGFAGVFLRRLSHTGSDQMSTNYYDQYARVRSGTIAAIDDKGSGDARGNITTLYVRQDPDRSAPPRIYPDHILQLRNGPDSQLYKLYGTMGNRSDNPLSLSGTWIPKGIKSAFSVAKQRNRLAAVAVFQRLNKSDAKFTVLLGSASDTGDVGFHVLDGWDEARTFGEWARVFEPQPLEPAVDLGYDSVQVRIESSVVHNRKYFMVDIDATLNRSFVDTLMEAVAKEIPGVTTGRHQRRINGLVKTKRLVAPQEEIRAKGFSVRDLLKS